MIHEQLKAIRLKSEKTQKDLADYLNISPQSVSKWEKGEVLPSLEYLPKIAKFYNCDMNIFFEKESSENISVDMLDAFFQLAKDVVDQKKDIQELSFYLENNQNIKEMLVSIYQFLIENSLVSLGLLKVELRIDFDLANCIIEGIKALGIVIPFAGTLKVVYEKASILRI